MKKFAILLVLCLGIAVSPSVNAQKIKVKSGDLGFLKGQKKINVQFTYDNMRVGKRTESEYIREKVEKYNKDEKGKGERWQKDWVGDREGRFEPKFLELITKVLDKKGVDVGKNDDAEYTMIVHTTFTEPGFNVGVMRQNAYIDAEIIFVETANPGKKLAVMTALKAPGRDVSGYDFESGKRVEEAYAKLGKSIGNFLAKKALK